MSKSLVSLHLASEAKWNDLDYHDMGSLQRRGACGNDGEAKRMQRRQSRAVADWIGAGPGAACAGRVPALVSSSASRPSRSLIGLSTQAWVTKSRCRTSAPVDRKVTLPGNGRRLSSVS